MEGSIMNKNITAILRGIIFSLFIGLFSMTNTYAGEYESLNGLNDIKVVFDVRGKIVKKIAIQLDLIHQTYKEQNIRKISAQPKFAVVFGGGAVELLSNDTDGFTDEEKVLLGQITKTLSAMAKDGIKLEICLFAANLHGVDPATVLPVIQHVDNGWISLIGYQAKGYSLVAAF
jgi:uncharacterized protein